MPVSHLGLTVSHIPSATSFYLSALSPLGYHYIGQRGTSIGLGVIDADFFLCQAENGSRVSPTHIAFSADNRNTVRDCYAAALNAGGRPSGSPSYRNNDCSCFNAAIEDLDGNTVEFIFRESTNVARTEDVPAPSEYTWKDSSSRGGFKDDGHSVATKTNGERSRMQTALDVASNTSKSMKKPEAPTSTLSRSKTEPAASTGTNGGKALVGTLIGAAAGAAAVYAAISSERQNAREEANYSSSIRSKAPSVKDSKRSTVSSKTSRSDRSKTESNRYPPRSMRAIEQTSYDDPEVQQAISKYNSSHRPIPQRSQTYDGAGYMPRQIKYSDADRFSMKRASTLPGDMPNYYIEGPRSMPVSRRTSRRGSFDDSALKRQDSGVSVNSHRSRRRSFDGNRQSFSKASTVKPARRNSVYDSAVDVPLPASKAPSRFTDVNRGGPSKAPSYTSAAKVPLPQSRATSYISAANMPLPPSYVHGQYTDDPEDSDGLSDMKTVVPDDSISCVDFSEPKRKSKSNSKASRQTSKRSEADSDRTVRGPSTPSASRHSAMTMPMRPKDNYYNNRSGKRSTLTYA